MNIIMGGALILVSTAMARFSSHAGDVPVSHPIYRVRQDGRPVYFWTLIGGYVFVAVVGLYTIAH